MKDNLKKIFKIQSWSSFFNHIFDGSGRGKGVCKEVNEQFLTNTYCRMLIFITFVLETNTLTANLLNIFFYFS